MNRANTTNAFMPASLLLFCLALLSSNVLAQQRLDPVVVGGKPQRADETVSPRTADLQELGTAITTVTDSNEITLRRPDRIEALSGYLVGVLPGIESGGLGIALIIRGIELNNRTYLNGQPDFRRLYVRDFSTIDSVTILRGPASTLFGYGSPAGAVVFETKRPLWKTHASLEIAGGSNGYFRSELDAGGLVGDNATVRFVGATQQGRTATNIVDIDRESAFATIQWRNGLGTNIRIEAEEQTNRRPFAFGTVHINGGVVFDAQYVAPQSTALRKYDRLSAYVDHEFNSDFSIHAAATGWRAARNETLVGFWTIESPTELSGYYTKYADRATQQSLLAEARAKLSLLGTTNRVALGFESNATSSRFVGEQSINSFSIDPYKPDFSNATNNLNAKPRNRRDRTSDSAIYLQDRVDLSSATVLALGLRNTSFEQASSRSLTGDLATSTRGNALGYQAGLVHRIGTTELHANVARVVEPNSGVARDGSFLAPKVNDQAEIGWRYVGARSKLSIAGFHIIRKNDPVTDPLDRNADIAAGKREFSGVEIAGERTLDSWRVEANGSWLRPRNLVPTFESQGVSPPNVPTFSGALTLHRKFSLGAVAGSAWVGAIAVGPRFGDEGNTFKVPGYVRADAGVKWKAREVEFSVHARNLTNKAYVQAITAEDNVYQGERRSWWMTARWSY